MAKDAEQTTRGFLTNKERIVAAIIAVSLVLPAGLLILFPPDRVVALTSCMPSTTVTCSVLVDADVTAFATALATLGVAASLVSILGIRFSKVSAGGVTLENAIETGFEEISKEMTEVGGPAPKPTEPNPKAPESPPGDLTDADLQKLPPFADLAGQFLDDVRIEIYRRHHGLFLTHLLSTPKRSGYFRAAIFIVGHRQPVTQETIEGATMFLGMQWDLRKFEASWSEDGRLGVVVEAYGPFLILSEVRLASGERVLLSHYVEFSQHDLLTASSHEQS